ncbi:protein DBF4 homolog A [Cricetulus griseus]|uniref:Protein DBF4 homolog A n=1 Tax=Cricetulus griseus TaxID=10029 RepID=DBF4A_CRIGR|nr:protein DBF4 homolog A [Cricetulus griseus]Q99MU0.1 RecName: Full=Protein DBF4 homolog A; AltName: Full=ChDBF4 [Cricetulus griseus]AAK21856.1 DBF4/ASK [Cricetulus griseus]
MNSGAMRIHSKGHFQGGIQVKNEKNRPSLKSLKTDNRPEKSKCKPLWEKVFYLDLPSVTISEKLQKDIKDLGGRVEEFLSKDISYLVSNKKEAKYAQTLGQVSPVPSPESAYTAETTSPHPSHDGSSFKSPDRVCLSRGKLLAEKAVKDHDFIPANSILSNALTWGVKILHIDDIRYYIEQKKKELCSLKKSSTSVRDSGKKAGTTIQKARTGRLKKPFLKVEDVNRSYRPFYLQLTSVPSINYATHKPCSPFDIEKPSSVQKQAQPKPRPNTDGDKCGGTPVQLQLKEKRKKGYCECCLQKYEDLETHLLSEKHKNFAQSNQYQVVDDIVSKLVFDFVEYERDTPKKKRIKYSVGSFSSVSANVLKNTEPKEKLQLEPIFQKDMVESNGQLPEEIFQCEDIQCEDIQKPEQRLVLASEPMSYSSTGLKGRDEKAASMLNASEPDIKQKFTQLPPCKNEQEGILDVSEHKLIINRNDLEQRVGDSVGVPRSCVQVSHLSPENSLPQPKLTADTTHFSAKDLQEKDLHFVFGHDSDLVTLNTSKEQLTVKAGTPSCGPQQPNECDTENTDNLPCGKIQRKVRLLLGQKKKNVDPSAELDKKRTEFLPMCEDRTCGSPVQSLLDLFQTSGEKSDFLGFTSYTENSGLCDVLDVWEDENSSSLLSTFFSSPSASTFIGF